MLFGKKTRETSRLTAAEVEHMLEKAELADYCGASGLPLSAGTEKIANPYPNLHEARDGVWVCCCGYENALVHFKGAFPFKRLVCGACRQVLCTSCKTTGIISVQDQIPKNLSGDGAELQLFQVCPSCGLSHRAEYRSPDHHGKRICWVPVASHSHAEMCYCGETAKFDWAKYAISRPGSEKAAHAGQLQSMRRKTGQMLEQYVQERPKLVKKRVDSMWEMPGLRHAETYEPESEDTSIRDATAYSMLQMSSHPSSNDQIESNIDVTAPSLKRSGAQRGRRPSQTPRSVTFRPSPVARRPGVVTRAETWTTADGHRRAHDAAEAAIKDFLGSK